MDKHTPNNSKDDQPLREDEALHKALKDREFAGAEGEKRLNAQIPSGLHNRFKKACKEEGRSMTTVLVSLIETWLRIKNE
jgi:hypothetical protein